MHSSTLVGGASTTPPTGREPPLAPDRGLDAVDGALGRGPWFRRHGASLCWVVPLLGAGLAVEVVIVGSRDASASSSPSGLGPGYAAAVLAAVSALLLWAVARRLRLSRPISAAALLLFLFSPIALLTHTTPTVQNAAAVVLLASAVVALDRRVRRRFRMIALTLGGALLVVVVALAFVVPGTVSSEPVATAPEATLAGWWSLDPALLILGVASSLVGLAIRRLRPLALVSVAFVLVLLRPGAELPGGVVVVWLPLAALLVAGAVGEAVQYAFDADFTAVWQEVLAGVFLVATVGVFIFAAPALAPGYRSLLPGSGAPSVAAPTAAPATTGTDPAAPGAASSPAAPAADPTPAAAPTLAATTDPAAQAAATAEATAAAERTARASAGAQLAENPDLALTDQAATELRAGEVDVRSILALGQLVASTEVSVADFPAFDGEGDQPRRQILVTALGGAAASDEAQVKDDLTAYVTHLNAPISGATAVATDDGVLVIFPFGEPVELLPATGTG